MENGSLIIAFIGAVGDAGVVGLETDAVLAEEFKGEFVYCEWTERYFVADPQCSAEFITEIFIHA